ncbi:hypothetical protein EDEG_01553 [Edhazardia aedis USNM 41457]|uniref:Uncharacterized protein n=1 Tax=Edhazardia aedis (strain USNM 41457) TaxID=1003232 RepID=J8ZWW4_EDHAE|nr:hypothetical protein EDEG_01553 [Edhazardia aedis USNM 41457]|eukprot:EJW04158.1 hypothetical protein EDEG_01553 [Edhazardia aedis USNM 41457]
MLIFLFNSYVFTASNSGRFNDRIRKINMDIVNYEDDIHFNQQIIDKLNTFFCCNVRHNAIKTKISEDIVSLEKVRTRLVRLDPEDCFYRYGKFKEYLIDDINRKILSKNMQWDSQVKSYNESLCNIAGYERINESLRKKINSLKAEKYTLQMFQKVNK